MFSTSSTLRSNPTPQKDLELANALLESAKKTEDPQFVLGDVEAKLSRMKRTTKQSLLNPSSDEDRSLRQGAAAAYLELGKQWATSGNQGKALKCLKRAESFGAQVPGLDQLVSPSQYNLNGKSVGAASAPTRGVVVTPTLPPHIFAENKQPLTIPFTLPSQDERLSSTPQLVYCLSLLQIWMSSPDAITDPTLRTWLKTIENDEDEKERFNTLATDLLRVFANDELKDSKAVAEVINIAPVLQKDNFRYLLRKFYDGVDRSDLLNVSQLEGLAQIIQGAVPNYLDSDDLVKILKLLNARLKDTHSQSPHYIYRLTLGVSNVLDAMADTGVDGLDREQLHEPLLAYLESLKKSSDPYLVYQAAYAFQALQYVPDNETPWEAAMRRTGKVIQGVSGLVSAAKAFDLSGFIEGLGSIQQGLAGVTEIYGLAKTAYEGVSSLVEGGQGFLESLKEGLSFERKQAWYSALRGADALIRDGRFAEFRKLVCEAPCRHDPAFQWGVCQRLGILAANQTWDTEIRQNAIEFLGDIYQNDAMWGQKVNVKQWIVHILMQLASLPGSALQSAATVLQQLETNGDLNKQALYQACRREGPGSYPIRFSSPEFPNPSLLDIVQNKPDVEGSIRQLRRLRLKERGNAVYIPPQAKASIQAPDDARFPLMEKMKEFLESNQTVFLLLGDSGSGKSTFNRALEYEMWNLYEKKDGYIPLYINLPSIEKPDQDLIAKQLRRQEFLEPQIRELKATRKFILICDGYDESQQTRNLYMSNQLNDPEEWMAKMVISCRSEYIGRDYRDRFQPMDQNRRSQPELFQQAVITPFSMDQVRDYIYRYVTEHRPLWETDHYLHALDQIPSLKELVKNPFLLTLSLEVLPRMTDPGQHLSATRVTRVALYDQFVEQWFERSKRRLGEKDMSHQAKAAFESLSDEGFTVNGVDYLKKLSVAIYMHQGGNPVVDYSRFMDEGTWKATFFGRDDEKMLLREACPLSRSGNQYRFIHRSLLEYGLACAVFDPQEWKAKKIPEATQARRRSVSSIMSFENQDEEMDMAADVEQGPDLNSPLVRKSFVNESSVIHFLEERVRQEYRFKRQLMAFIELSKDDKKWRVAAANAITILVRAGVQFIGMDLQGIQVPGADLSHGVFDSTQMKGADLRKANLRNAWLFGADLSKATMGGVQFGEQPYISEESWTVDCTYSPDGRHFVAGTLFGDISVYTTSNWEKVRSLTGHDDELHKVVISPNGLQIASSSSDNTIRLWNLETGGCLHTLTGHTGKAWCVVFSPEGDQVASCSHDKTVRLWDVESGACLRTYAGHTAPVKIVVFSPKGDLIASSSRDKTVRLWNVDSGACLHVFNFIRNVRIITFSPKGDQIASGGEEREMRLWDVEAGECRPLSGHEGYICSVAYSPKGDHLASGSEDYTVQLWDVGTGVRRFTLRGHEGDVTIVVFSPKGDQIASGSRDHSIRLWDVESGTCRRAFGGHRLPILSIVFSPEGDQIASGSEDSTIRLWDVETGASQHTLSHHGRWINTIAFSPRGNQIATGSEDNTARLWDMETGMCQHTLVGGTGMIDNVVFSPKDNEIACGGRDNEVQLWNTETGVYRQTFISQGRTSWGAVYSPQGDLIVTGNEDYTLQVWEVETGICRHILNGHDGYTVSAAFSPKGDLLASGGADGMVRLWNVETGACTHVLTAHTSIVYAIAFSPKEDLLATGSADNTLKLWDTEKGVCRQTLSGHNTVIDRVVFSPNGGQLASGSTDGMVRLWSVETGSCHHIFTIRGGITGGVVYLFNGTQLACGSESGTLQFWDVESGESRGSVELSRGDVRMIAWKTSSDGVYVATGGIDGSVRLYQLTEKGDQYNARLCWSSSPKQLTITGASLQEVQGLSTSNKLLVHQHGAVGEI